MERMTTTRATHRGIDIRVVADTDDNGNTYSCTNNSAKLKKTKKWFATQREALASERQEIDSILR